jgi:hypothetical protein
MPDLIIRDMAADVRGLNTDKGWRAIPLGVRELSALLHTEIAEATDAFRRWGLYDATEATDHVCPDLIDGLCMCPAKPEGVGAELADTLIRLLDMADRLGDALVNSDLALADIAPLPTLPADVVSFPDHTDLLHDRAYMLKFAPRNIAYVRMLRTIVTTAQRFGIDLDAEYRRKMAHNWTRPHLHGGKRL